MYKISDSDALLLCDEARHRHPLDRALLLAVQGEFPGNDVADSPLGLRNSEILRLHSAQYGDALEAYVDCAQCHERLEFTLSCQQLLSDEPADLQSSFIDVEGWKFRLPTSRDLAQIAPLAHQPQEAIRNLLLRCCVNRPQHAGVDNMLSLVPQIAQKMECADPLADVRLQLNCEYCGHTWLAYFDASGFVWEELESRSAQLLDDVHLLAAAYGWSEQQVLALSEQRRTAYRERVLR